MPSTLDESFRYLAYAGLVAAALVVVERRTVPQLLGGVTAAIALLSLYALGTRLLPDRLGAFEPILGYRLTGTIGYWNGLGIFAVIGLLLALGFAARADRPATRALAGAALPVLAATMYFTFSRGAWLALLVGLAAAFARRPAPAAARVRERSARRASGGRRPARIEGRRADASRGRRSPPPCATATSSLRCSSFSSALSAAVAVVLWWAERRVRVPSSLRLAWAAALVVVLLAGVGAVSAAGGIAGAARPAGMGQGAGRPAGDREQRAALRPVVERPAASSGTPPGTPSPQHPVAGEGGGTYWQAWAQSPHGVFTSTEAHSVYAETLAELGMIGLVLLLVVLVPPFVGAVRARRSPLVPFALAAFAGWVVHAGVDWDWELTGVTGAALLCGVALVAAGRGAPRALPSGRARRRARARRAADGARRDERAREPAARLGPGRAAAGRPRAGGGGRPQIDGGSLPGRHVRSR